MSECCKKILIDDQAIINRCKELANQINTDYADKSLLVVGILKGSVPFMAELITHITIDVEIDFMAVSSYAGTESLGDIKVIKDLDDSVKDKNILIIEDIIDTGLTLKKLIELLTYKGAKEVKVCTLLDKKERRTVDIEADYVGFEIENEFVIGFGLDYNQKYRNLPYIGVIKDELI